jgi:hypothetical protein
MRKSEVKSLVTLSLRQAIEDEKFVSCKLMTIDHQWRAQP